MERLENAQLQALEEIRRATDTHTCIREDNEEITKIIKFLAAQKFISSQDGGWVITEQGRSQLSQEQKSAKRERTGTVQGWVSLAISAAALAVSTLALLSK